MLVAVNPGSSELADTADFTNFHVQCPLDWTVDELDHELRRAGAGSASDASAVIQIEWILNAIDHDSGWRKHFDSMVRYAESRGWVSEDGTAILAHIAYVSSP